MGLSKAQEEVPDNIIELDLSQFSKEDVEKIKALGEKQKLCYRWFRYERLTEPGIDQFMIYSGARSQTPYSIVSSVIRTATIPWSAIAPERILSPAERLKLC